MTTGIMPTFEWTLLALMVIYLDVRSSHRSGKINSDSLVEVVIAWILIRFVLTILPVVTSCHISGLFWFGPMLAFILMALVSFYSGEYIEGMTRRFVISVFCLCLYLGWRGGWPNYSGLCERSLF
jgi:hypothetical protein